jgi:glycerol-3-phosphate dehydrogenase
VSLSPLEQRAADLDRLARGVLDVLVIGGGIVGSGAALDAALRGARVALVEQDDIGAGTSSRSSKLIHGGLRYLELFQFGLVHQALTERRRLLRLAPHLVRLERFMAPVYGSPMLVPYLAAGLTLYGGLGAARDGGWPTFLTASRAIATAPDLRPVRVRGAFTYTDGVEDDARLALAVVRTARRAGAVVLTRARAAVAADGRPAEVELDDRLSGRVLRVKANVVIDATGASHPDELTMPSRGSHLLVPRERIAATMGLTIRVPGRVIFVIPWYRHWIIGTTDVPHGGDTHRPSATGAEVDYLLEHANEALQAKLTRDDVVATYAGIRPLVAPPGNHRIDTVRASREHRIERRNRTIFIRGGKLTTYRIAARDAVDEALGRQRGGQAGTDRHPLIGAAPTAELSGVASTLAQSYGLAPSLSRRLVERHGTEALDLVRESVRRGLLQELGGSSGYLEGEVAWAVRQELGLSLDDVMARRMRLALEARDHGVSVAKRVADIIGDELGWSTAQRRAAPADYAREAAREYGVPGGEQRPLEERVAV